MTLTCKTHSANASRNTSSEPMQGHLTLFFFPFLEFLLSFSLFFYIFFLNLGFIFLSFAVNFLKYTCTTNSTHLFDPAHKITQLWLLQSSDWHQCENDHWRMCIHAHSMFLVQFLNFNLQFLRHLFLAAFIRHEICGVHL